MTGKDPLEFVLRTIVETDDVNEWERDINPTVSRYPATEDMGDFARMVMECLRIASLPKDPNRAPIPGLTPEERMVAEAELIPWLEHCVDKGSMTPEQAADYWLSADL